jgi:hypothetical protein
VQDLNNLAQVDCFYKFEIFFLFMKFKFGESVSGFEYPVLNERAVRATAGVMFAIGIITLMYTRLTQDFTYLKIVVSLFFLDFGIKIFFGPKLSPLSYLGRVLVSNQKPEWVGAIQKRFAWSLGFLMSGTMVLLVLVLGMKGWYTLTICGICLTFMWLETALGLCVGCKLYPLAQRFRLISVPKTQPLCPGGVCQVKRK